MAGKALIIVESPTKAKTIKKFLKKDVQVLACMGHVRDLPERAADIPAKYKKEKWSRLGVNVEDGFKPLYVVSNKKAKTIKQLKDAMKDAEVLYLASDEDREGESISWHLVEVLKPKIPTKRMVFHEITKKAIEQAFDEPRELDMRLVQAQEARRVLDRLVGYTVSPLIWKKIAYGLSAGRVQSVALKTICDLELQRLKFKKANYWGIQANLIKDAQDFEARLTQLGEKKIAVGKDFDEHTGGLKEDRKNKVVLLDEKAAIRVQEDAKDGKWLVKSIEAKPVSRKPAAPFITSTLQQEANRKLGLSARDTMRIAQSLYEKGYITYMRTDSVNLSGDAIKAARSCVERLFGNKFLHESVRQFSGKSKGAQEAHEAIRPSLDFTPPSEIKLSGKDHALYEMIWMRTVATQMAEAKQQQVSAQIAVNTDKGEAVFHASGMKILFPGFLKAYVEGQDDHEKALANRERFLPDLKEGQPVDHKDSKVTKHETKPPARYTEASLIQFMEREGIGRPSTYASIVSTIVDRGYCKKTGNALVPTFTGIAVNRLMSNHFKDLVDINFTSVMEEKLDKIAEGELEHTPYLKSFFLGNDGLQEKVQSEDKNIQPEEARKIHFDHLDNFDVFIGRYGPYFIYKDPNTGEEVKASVPDNLAPSDLNNDSLQEIVKQAKEGPKPVATDPETQKPIFLKTGSYGPYLQLGDLPDEETGKLKRVTVPASMKPDELTEEQAIGLMSLPRDLGEHPDTGKVVKAHIGRFGPYVVHDGDFRSVKDPDDVTKIELPRALEIFAQPKRGRGKRKKEPIHTPGKHPETEVEIHVYDGPYGPYVNYEKTNAPVPEDKDPKTLSLQDAIALLDAKGAFAKKKTAKKKAAKKKAAKKKTTTAGKKKAAKKKASKAKKKASS